MSRVPPAEGEAPGDRQARSQGEPAEGLARLGLFDWDLSTDAVTLDERAREIWGFEADAAPTSADVFARIHPEDLPRVRAEVGAARQGLSRLVAGCRVSHPDGTTRAVETLGAVRAGPDGLAARVAGVFEDVTAGPASAAALRTSEARYRQIVEGAEDFAIVALDEAGVITDWNSGAERILGWARAEAIGRPGSIFFTPEDVAEGVPDREMNRAASAERAVNERWHLRRDGSRFWGSGLIMRLDAGGFLKMFRDRTAEHEAEAALRRSEARAQAIFEAIEAGFCVVEVRHGDAAQGARVDYRVVEANPAFYAQTGFPEAILGRWLREAAPALEEHWYEVYGRVARTGEPVRFEQGSEALGRWFDVYAFRAEEGAGPAGEPRPARLAILFNDISARRRAELALAALNRELEARVAERTAERDRIWQVSRDLLGVADERGVWLSVNPAWTRVLGWEAHEIVGRTSEWMEHPEDRARTRAEVRQLAAGEETLAFENRFRARDGRYRDLSWTAVPEAGLLYGVARDVTDEKRRARALVLFENIVQSDASPICAYDTAHRVIAFNRAHGDDVLRVMGRPARLGEALPDLFAPGRAAALRALMDRALAGESFRVEAGSGDAGLAMPQWEVDFAPVRDGTGAIVGAFHHARDVTARLRAEAELRSLEEQLRQSQKMEAVGQLTGGLAHDFNNLLAGIQGSLEMIGARIAQGRLGDVERYLVAAQGAARRAAALTHRLLAFSRRQTLAPKPTDVAALVAGMEELVSRTVGPAIAVESVMEAGLWPVSVDPNQLENALLNLAINARDAMPDGGRLTVEAANRPLDAQAAGPRDLPAGQYVALCVSDTGTGMTPDVAARAFEPFFTTKPIGQGTGLGLSMVYGFARQSGGEVRIVSEAGRGTTICLYLPRHLGGAEEDEAAPEAAGPGAAGAAGAGGTVLVIDDEPVVRMLIVDVLEELGCAAIEAADGPTGLEALRSAARVDLLVTDVGLPGGLNGRQVADAARALRPGLPVLFVTGYAENAVLNHGHLEPGMQVITKPFDVDEMGRRVRAILGGR